MILSTGKFNGQNLLINDPADYLITFFDTANAITAVVADANWFRVEGLGEFYLENVRAPRASRGRMASNQVITITTADVTISGVVDPNTLANVFFKIDSTKYEAEFHTSQITPNRNKSTQVVLQPSTTQGQVLAQMYNNLRFEYYSTGGSPWYTITGVGAFNTVGRATTLTSLVITFTKPTLYIDSTNVSNPLTLLVTSPTKVGVAATVSTYFTSPFLGINFAITTPQDEGNNTSDRIYQTIRVQTESNTYPYAAFKSQLPLKGVLYTDFKWQMFVVRKDVFNHGSADATVTALHDFQLFVNESHPACEPIIEMIAQFFQKTTVAGVSPTGVTTVQTFPKSAYGAGGTTYIKDTATIAQFMNNG